MGLNNREGALYFATGIDTRGIEVGSARIRKELSGITKQAIKEGEEMNKVFRRLGQAMAGYFTLTSSKQFISDVVRVRGEFQQLDIAFQTMLGNKEKADRLMAQIVDFATRTPFQLTEVATGTKQLLAVGVEAEKALPTLKALSDVAAGLSVPLERLIMNFGQVRTQTTLTSRELRDFNMAGVPLVAELSKNLGQSEKAIKEMVTAGEIGFADVEAAFISMTEEGGRFANLTDKQMASVTGQVSLLQDAWNRMLNDIGQANEGVIVDTIQGLTKAVENYEDIIDILTVLVATYGTYKGTLIAVNVIQKRSLIATQVTEYFKMAKALGFATANQIAFNRAAIANPYGLIAAGIAAIVSSLMIFNARRNDAIGVSASFQKELKQEVGEIEKNFNALKKAKEGTDARKRAIDEINTKYQEYLPNLLTEKTNLEGIADAQDAITESIAKTIALRAKETELENIRKKSQEAGNAYSKAFNKTFGDRGRFTSQEQGQVSAELDKLIQNSHKASIGIKDIYEAMETSGAKAKLGAVESDNLFRSINSYIIALLSEKDAVKDLDEVYNSYLQKLGLVKEQQGGINQTTPDTNKFDIKEYQEYLKTQYNEYEKYLNTKYQLGEEFADRQFSSLIKQGDTYADFLNKQLQLFSNNEEAKISIAQAANKAGISLLLREDMKKLAPTTKVDVSKEFEIDSKTLKSMDKLIDKWEWLAKVMNAAFNEDKNIQFGNQLAEAGGLLQEMAQTAGHFDEELSRALGTMGNLAASIGTAVASWNNNPLMAATGIVGAVGTLVSLFDQSAKKQEIAAMQAKILSDELERQNAALERQIRLLNEAAGVDRISMEKTTMSLIDQQIEDLDKAIDETGAKLTGMYDVGYKDVRIDIDSIDFSGIEDLENFLFGGGYEEFVKEAEKIGLWDIDFSNQQELLDLYNQVNDLLERRKELMSEIIGSTEQELAQSLIDGLEEGMTAIDAFANTFEDAMRRAIISSFETMYLMPVVEQMIEQIYTGMSEAKRKAYTDSKEKRDMKNDISATGDGLSDDEYYKFFLNQEIDAIKKNMTDSVSELSEGWGIVNDILEETGLGGFGSSGSQGLAGAIKRELTEETGSMLAGLFNIMSVDVRTLLTSYQTNAASQANMMMQTISILNEIEENTGRTADNTEELDRLKTIEEILGDIRDGGSSGGGKR